MKRNKQQKSESQTPYYKFILNLKLKTRKKVMKIEEYIKQLKTIMLVSSDGKKYLKINFNTWKNQ